MLRIFAAAMLATSLYAAAASAAGGGAEPMPGTNYTDMPSYHPCRSRPHLCWSRPAGRLKHARKHVRRYSDFARGH